VTFDEYVAIPALNFSLLKTMVVSLNPLILSPAKFHYHETHERPDTDAMHFGRALHCAALEFEQFPVRFCVWTGGDRRSKAYREWAETVTATGAEELTRAEYDKVLAMRASIMAHPEAVKYLSGADKERTIVWSDPVTGLLCKCRIDALSAAVADLKSTNHADPWHFARTVVDYCYHAQMAHYCAGVKSETGRDHSAAIIAVEKTPPHEVGVYEMAWDSDDLWAGQELIRLLLQTVKQCRETGEWPGAYPATMTLTLPNWAMPSDGTAELEGYR
jgi:hypothetical protein